jgi:hypothetical protein
MEGLAQGIDATVRLCFFLIIVAVPLALWKLFDIAYWLFHHVHISF